MVVTVIGRVLLLVVACSLAPAAAAWADEASSMAELVEFLTTVDRKLEAGEVTPLAAGQTYDRLRTKFWERMYQHIDERRNATDLYDRLVKVAEQNGAMQRGGRHVFMIGDEIEVRLQKRVNNPPGYPDFVMIKRYPDRVEIEVDDGFPYDPGDPTLDPETRKRAQRHFDEKRRKYTAKNILGDEYDELLRKRIRISEPTLTQHAYRGRASQFSISRLPKALRGRILKGLLVSALGAAGYVALANDAFAAGEGLGAAVAAYAKVRPPFSQGAFREGDVIVDAVLEQLIQAAPSTTSASFTELNRAELKTTLRDLGQQLRQLTLSALYEADDLRGRDNTRTISLGDEVVARYVIGYRMPTEVKPRAQVEVLVNVQYLPGDASVTAFSLRDIRVTLGSGRDAKSFRTATISKDGWTAVGLKPGEARYEVVTLSVPAAAGDYVPVLTWTSAGTYPNGQRFTFDRSFLLVPEAFQAAALVKVRAPR
jgi:hypothetical protein